MHTLGVSSNFLLCASFIFRITYLARIPAQNANYPLAQPLNWAEFGQVSGHGSLFDPKQFLISDLRI